MNLSNPPRTRRQVLRAGSAVLALPWLETFARADEKIPPKRIICVCTSFGLYGPSFFPAKPGREYEASEYLRVLGDLRDKYTVFSGISHPDIGGDHASEACFLTSAKHPTRPGFRNTVSLDVLVSQHVAGATPDGKAFAGVKELRAMLAKQPDQLARGVTRHLLTYATGQPAKPLDQPTIEAIVKGAAKDDYGLRSLVHGIVQSETFRSK